MSPLAPGARASRRTLLASLAGGIAGVVGTSLRAQVGASPSAFGEPQDIEVSAQPTAGFGRAQPAKGFAGLKFRSGVRLTSPAAQFGGWSGLVLDSDGSKLLAVSDLGNWFSADISYDHDRMVALKAARIGPLKSLRGEVLGGKREQDAEALVLVEGTLASGTLLIGFERQHRIGRFPVRRAEVLAPTGYLTLPAEARRLRANQGFEALAILKAGPRQGSVVAFAERLTSGSGYHTGWIWLRGGPQSFALLDLGGFDITDAVGLPDGGLLLLERYFRWTAGVKMRIRRLLPGEIEPGARLTGRTLLEVDSSHEIDNMEAIAAHRGQSGETILTLISDDNFSYFQRTLLLQFTLLED
jgi:hypothetical protein